ncbi:MAG: hypothetical protein NTX01_09215 [Candidatus Omnitrophica bacterium]|nr:hypothetical protein [Candidatus Omnitrophota bacterium]
MHKIRDLFHAVGNCHNKISVGAGVAKIELMHNFKDRPLPPEIKKALSRLNDLERNAVESSDTLNQLKEAVYKIIDPDTSQKRNRRQEK